MNYDKDIKGKTVQQMLDLFSTTHSDYPQYIKQLELAILYEYQQNLIKSIGTLTSAINNASRNNESLSRKLLYLNITLTILTAIGTFFIVWSFIPKIVDCYR